LNIWEQLPQFIISGLTTGSIYALVGLGFCLIHNATGIVNFAQGDFLSLGGLMMYSLLFTLGLPVPLAFVGACLAVGLAGFVLDRFALRPARQRPVLILIFITIGCSIFMRGVFMEVWGKEDLALPSLSTEVPLHFLGAVFTPQNLWVLGFTALAIGLLVYFFNCTLVGKAMRATSVNRKAAALSGIDTDRMIMYSFGLAGSLGALAGVLITPITSLSYGIGVLIGLKGYAAAVLGGYGSFMGAVAGGLALGLLESLAAGILTSTFKDVIAFVVLLLVLFVRPSGFFGFSEQERV
jgi:branched-chain amino acid transport system permease protein